MNNAGTLEDSNKPENNSLSAYKSLSSGKDLPVNKLALLLNILLNEKNTKYIYLTLINCKILNLNQMRFLKQQLYKNLIQDRDFRFIYWTLVEIEGLDDIERKELIKIFVEEVLFNTSIKIEDKFKYINRSLGNLDGYSRITDLNPIQLNILRTILKSSQLSFAVV